MDDSERRQVRKLIAEAHEWLVRWSEDQGFSWIDVDVFHYPSQMLILTVKHSKHHGLQGRIILSAEEAWNVSRVELFGKLLPLKTTDLLEEFAIRIQRLEEEKKKKTHNALTT